MSLLIKIIIIMKSTIFNALTFIITALQCDIILGEKNLISEDARLDFIGLATKYGHPPVQYDVTTEDGYILSLFHLPGRSKLPVLLMHGFLDSADSFLLRGNNSLGIRLANSGYDVWLGNCRGNRYSRRHHVLDPNKDSFYWNFTFHEMGYYDLPTFIDKVLNETGAPTLTAMGHSQGNTIFWIMGSTRPEYNEKINVMVALAPVCYLHNSPLTLRTLIGSVSLLYNILESLNVEVNEFLGYDNIPTKILRAFCPTPIIGYQVCLNQLCFFVIGFDLILFEPQFLDKFIYHYPIGTSWRVVLHFNQIMNSRIFRQYNYGFNENIRVYNSSSPPVYNLQKVTMPVAMLTSRNDPLATEANVALLRQQLPNVVDYVVNSWWLFTHGDYNWGRDAQVHLLPYISPILSRYNPM